MYSANIFLAFDAILDWDLIFLYSSHASQNSRFSSLNSVRRNALKAARPSSGGEEGGGTVSGEQTFTILLKFSPHATSELTKTFTLTSCHHGNAARPRPPTFNYVGSWLLGFNCGRLNCALCIEGLGYGDFKAAGFWDSQFLITCEKKERRLDGKKLMKYRLITAEPSFAICSLPLWYSPALRPHTCACDRRLWSARAGGYAQDHEPSRDGKRQNSVDDSQPAVISLLPSSFSILPTPLP